VVSTLFDITSAYKSQGPVILWDFVAAHNSSILLDFDVLFSYFSNFIQELLRWPWNFITVV
jgi:hypothetical protein